MLEIVSSILVIVAGLTLIFVLAGFVVVWFRERNLSPEEKARRTQLRSGGMSKRHFRILLVVRLGVLGLLAGIVIVSFFEAREKYDQQFEPPVTSETKQQTSQQTPSGTVDTVTWQTYRNEEYGFEVKYPPTSWTAEPIATGVQLVNQESVLIAVTNINRYDVYDYDPQLYDSALEAYLDITLNQKGDKVKETFFQGYPAYEVLFSGLDSSYSLFIEKNGLVYSIAFSSGLNEIERTILSTFRFAEPLETSSWQTYRNDEYGFEFEYPNEWNVRTVQTVAYGDTFVPAISIGESVNGKDPSRVQIIIWGNVEALPDSNASLTFEQWLLEEHSVYFGNFLPAGFENIRVGLNNYPAFQKWESTTAGVSLKINSVFLEKDGRVFNFRGPLLNRIMDLNGNWRFDAIYQEVEGHYNQILSTFRFLE